MLSILVALGVLIAVGYFGPSITLASDSNPVYNKLVNRIADKFHLQTSDVKAVFDAVREERLTEAKERMESDLGRAVRDGVLTEEQKDELVLKMDEEQQFRLNNRRKILQWLKSQGINPNSLRNYLGRKSRL